MKKINKPRIIERLRSRFALTDVERELFTLGENVILVTNVDELLQDWNIFFEPNASRTAAAGVGYVDIILVPAGKRYTFQMLQLSRLSGDGTITMLRIIDQTGAYACTIASQTAASGFVLPGTEGVNVIADELLKFEVYVNAITTDSVWSLRWYGAKEDAF